MIKKMIIDATYNLEFWKILYEISGCERAGFWVSIQSRYPKAQGELIHIKEEKVKKAKEYVNLIDALIEDTFHFGHNILWYLEPDTCTVYINTDITREKNKDEYWLPFLKTKNIYTFPSIMEILYDKTPKSVMFLLSEQCNLNCAYCFEKHDDNSIMTLDIAKKAIDLFFTDANFQEYFKDSPSIILEFMGGEPLLFPELIEDICNYFYRSCIKYNKIDWLLLHQFNITSNGTLYFEEKVQKLIKHFPEISISISLDGTRISHDKNRQYRKDKIGSFDDVIKAIKQENKMGKLMAPKLTFTHNTIDDLYNNIKFIASTGCKSLSISPALEQAYTPEEGYAYYNQLLLLADFLIDNKLDETFFNPFIDTTENNFTPSEAFCGGEGKMITISPNGSISTCHRILKSVYDTEIGDIQNGLMQTESHKANFDFIVTHKISDRKWSEKCKECIFKGKCISCPGIDWEQHNIDNVINTNACYLNLATYAASIYYFMKKNCCIKEKYIAKNKDYFLQFLPEEEVELLIEIENMGDCING